MDTMKDTPMQPAKNAVIEELRNRLEAAEKKRDDLALRLVQSDIGKREISEARDALRVEIEELHVLIAAVKKQADAEFCLRVKKEEEYARLRAKIEQMERQEPVGTTHAMPGASAFTMACFDAQDIPVGAKLYALPGAKGESE